MYTNIVGRRGSGSAGASPYQRYTLANPILVFLGKAESIRVQEQL